MPARPTQGGSSGTWGTELNAHLDEALESATGNLKTAALGTSGTASSATFLRGDRAWATPGVAASGPIYATDFGVTADNVDCSVAFQALIDAQTTRRQILLPNGIIKANITIPDNIWLSGVGSPVFGSASAAGGTVIQANNNAADVIAIRPDATKGYRQNITLENLKIMGGRHGVSTLEGVVYLLVRNVEIGNFSQSGWYVEGWMEEFLFDFVRISGGQYCFRIANVLNTFGGGNTNYLDKGTFRQMYVAGGSINNYLLEALVFDGVSWDGGSSTASGQHGFVLNGGARDLTFKEYTTESNGTTGKQNITTGSITTGTPTLVVASATGYAIGDTVTVKGGKGYQGDLTALASNVVGTTITLDANATATVTAAAVTNAQWDDMVFRSSIAAPAIITLLGCQLGNGKLRYSIDASGISSSLTLIGFHATGQCPVYDPNGTVNIIGGSVGLRKPTAWNGRPLLGICVPSDGVGEGGGSFIGSPRGEDIVLGLPDSLGTSLGTFGKISVRKGNTNRDELMSLSGTTGLLSVYGGVDPGLHTTGFFSGKRLYYGAAAPASGTYAVGDIVFNSAPAAGGTVGWVCTTGGTPGVWKTFGAIAA